MSNLISADFYRVRRGATLRNVFLGIVALILLMMVMVLISQSDSYSSMVEASGKMMAPGDAAEMETDLAMAQQLVQVINNGAVFGLDLLGQFFVPLFFLPIAIATFCADFSANTYRNTLSYESSRTKVYLSKLVLTTVISLLMVVSMVAIGWVVGGIALGFSGFSAAYFMKVLTVLLLQLPIYLAYVAVCHCLVALTRKSSSTIAIFLVGFVALSLLFQTLAMINPSLDWLLLLDPQSGGRMMASYDLVSSANIMLVIGYNILVTIATTALGVVYFRKTDMP